MRTIQAPVDQKRADVGEDLSRDPRRQSHQRGSHQDFSYQTYLTYDGNTTTNSKARYFFCAQNGPSITHSSQHNGTSWKRAAEGQSFGLMLQLDLPIGHRHYVSARCALERQRTPPCSPQPQLVGIPAGERDVPELHRRIAVQPPSTTTIYHELTTTTIVSQGIRRTIRASESPQCGYILGHRDRFGPLGAGAKSS
jgi:hypothetical protein